MDRDKRRLNFVLICIIFLPFLIACTVANGNVRGKAVAVDLTPLRSSLLRRAA